MNLFYIANQIESLAAQLREMDAALRKMDELPQRIEGLEKHFEKLNNLEKLYDLLNQMRAEISRQSENESRMEEKYREEKDRDKKYREEKYQEEKSRMTGQLMEQQKSYERLRLEMEKSLHEKEEKLNYAQNQYRELYEMTQQIQEEGKKWRSRYIKLKKDTQSE